MAFNYSPFTACLRVIPHALALTMVLIAPVLQAQLPAPAVPPGINAPYLSPDISEWVRRFETPGRDVYDQRNAIVDAAGVKSGMEVADIGAGTGLFTRLFARRVGPTGQVFAIDISPAFVQNILRIASQEGLNNVVGVVNTSTDTLLPAHSIDLAFLSDTYHHLEYPKQMLQSIRRALRPGGVLVIVDFERISGVSPVWIMEHVRTGEEAVINEIKAEGFELVDNRAFLRENYFLKFVKR